MHAQEQTSSFFTFNLSLFSHCSQNTHTHQKNRPQSLWPNLYRKLHDSILDIGRVVAFGIGDRAEQGQARVEDPGEEGYVEEKGPERQNRLVCLDEGLKAESDVYLVRERKREIRSKNSKIFG